MSKITVIAGTIGEAYEGSETALIMRAYVTHTFTTSLLEAIVSGRLHTRNFYLSIPCTVSGGIVSYAEFILDSTDDAFSDPKRAAYTFALYTTNGTFRSLVYKKIRVPATPTPTTLAALAAHSFTTEPVGDQFYNNNQILALLALKANKAGDTFTGDIIVPAEVYGAGWNGSNEAPTKNDVYDKVETIVAGGVGNDVITNAMLVNMATKTYKGRTSALTGDPEDVPVATLKTDLVLVKADVGLGNVDNTSDANKPVSTAQAAADAVVLSSAEAYADNLVIGLLDDRGNYDASGNTFPASGGSGAAGAVKKGDLWTVSVAGTLSTHAVSAGDVVRALTDTPGQTDANWAITENNFGYVAENSANKDTDSTFAANSDTKYPSQKAVKTALDAKVSDTAYGAGWDAVTTIAPSKNAVYDKIEAIIAAVPGAYTDEQAQDAIGAMIDASLNYVDGTPLLQRSALTGDVTATAGSNATTIANNAVTTAKILDAAVTLAKLANIADQRILGNNTGGAAAPVALTAAQVRTILALVIGTDVQAWDTDLDAIAALAPSNDDIIQRKGGVWTKRTIAQLVADLGTTVKSTESFIVAVSDETTALTTGTSKITFRMPYAFTLTDIRASLSTSSSSGNPAINVKESGTTIFSTTLTIDSSEKTSTTAATPAVISDASLADDAEITIDVDTAGTGAKGLKLTFIGHRT